MVDAIKMAAESRSPFEQWFLYSDESIKRAERSMVSIKPRNIIFNSTKLVWKRFPKKWRDLLKTRGVITKLNRFGLRYEYLGIWPLSGALKGSRIRIEEDSQYQFIAEPYEPSVCAAIQKMVQPGWVCVDVGAHIGYITLLLCRLTGKDGKVFSFEAQPENAALLRKNIALNNYSERVTVENVAITDGNDRLVKLSKGNSSFQNKVYPANPNADGISVKAVSLDNYFQGKTNPDFIKMDIEGGEARAVKGMKWLLSNCQPILLLEIHETGRSCIEVLLAAGYRFYDLDLSPIDNPAIHSQLQLKPVHLVALSSGKGMVSG